MNLSLKFNSTPSFSSTFHVAYLFCLLLFFISCGTNKVNNQSKDLTEYVNLFLGTESISDPDLVGYTPPKDWRVWAGLTYPGAARPNAMVQLSPITQFGSGAGYEYEDSVIKGFAHTNKGHWNLCHIPVLPVTGEVSIDNLGSEFSHDSETASPGYYRVLLEDFDINVELTTTLRTGYHRYDFPEGVAPIIIFNLAQSNERVYDWQFKKIGDQTVSGYQDTGYKVFFYAEFNRDIRQVKEGVKDSSPLSSVTVAGDGAEPVEMKIGLSFVSVENAKENLQKEIGGRSFDDVKQSAQHEWEELLQHINVSGGTEREKELFYSSFYRSFLWPALRSDSNGEYRDIEGNIEKSDFNYYTKPALWDTFRNKLVLLGMISPEVTSDVIQSLIDRGEKTGFIPTFFHGDHAAPFIAGSYLRGIDYFDIQKAYDLLIRNATIEGGTRPYITEYMQKGYISTPDVKNPHVETKAKAAVTKTLEYAYDDYSIALLADTLGDESNYERFMDRSKNYQNLFDASTGFMRGRLENEEWVKNFDPQYPYYEYMYREANAWQSAFFVPHDIEGLMNLFDSKQQFQEKVDSLFSIRWNPDHIARNVCCFIGQYSQGNQPSHGYPYLYYFVDQQPKAQALINKIMQRFYGAGEHGLALSGMDDAGEMSSWYVFSAMGFYPYSPAEDQYLMSVSVFDQVDIKVGDNNFTIHRTGDGERIDKILLDGDVVENYWLPHSTLISGKSIQIITESE